MSVTIRAARPDEAPLLAELSTRTFRETYASNSDPAEIEAHVAREFTVEKQAALLASADSTVLLALRDDAPVGYAIVAFEPPPACVTGDRPIAIERIYLARDVLGIGAGSVLMEACLAEARRRGADTIWLQVWEENARAKAFYARWGFQPVGTAPFLFGPTTYEDLVLARGVAPAGRA
jgi:ribosomal protein S18 acetylase RimI-like enzyme